MDKPHIAFVVHATPREGSSAITNLFYQVQRNLVNSEGELVSQHTPRGRVIFKSNIIVCDSAATAYDIKEHIPPTKKLIALVHAFENPTRRAMQVAWLRATKPCLVIVTSDQEICDDMLNEGFKAVHVPITLGAHRFHHLPYPSEFTIGYMGANLTHKRFDVIDAVGKELGIPVVGSRRSYHSGGEYEARELDFYSKISCYVCATTCEKAPFPVLEALLCGRPIVSTPILSSPPEVYRCVVDGAGVLTDDLVQGVTRVKAHFDSYATAARTYKMRDTSSEYEKAILSVLE